VTPLAEAAPALPGSRMVKLAQSAPTWGSCCMVFSSRVVDCSLLSVRSSEAVSAVTTTCCCALPTFRCPSGNDADIQGDGAEHETFKPGGADGHRVSSIGRRNGVVKAVLLVFRDFLSPVSYVQDRNGRACHHGA